MTQSQKILALVPARGGSKGVPGKNTRMLGDKPLLAWAIDVAKQSGIVSKVVVSTDDAKAAEVAREYGADVLERPAELASDTAPMLPVMQHALKHYDEKGEHYDVIVLLQPTAPFRMPHQIVEAVELLKSTHADSIMSISPVPKHYSPFWQKQLAPDGTLLPAIETGNIQDDKKYTRKQDLPTTYWKNGMIYVTPRTTLLGKNSIYGDKCVAYVIDDEALVNIDTPFDFFMAEKLLEYRTRR